MYSTVLTTCLPSAGILLTVALLINLQLSHLNFDLIFWEYKQQNCTSEMKSHFLMYNNVFFQHMCQNIEQHPTTPPFSLKNSYPLHTLILNPYKYQNSKEYKVNVIHIYYTYVCFCLFKSYLCLYVHILLDVDRPGFCSIKARWFK